MKKRTRRFLLIGILQLLLLAAILLFPDTIKNRLARTPPADARTVIDMGRSAGDDPVVEALNGADLFHRYRFTRAAGSKIPGTAVLMLSDPRYAEYWHLEALLADMSREDLGMLILDFRDVASFVPIRDANGNLRSTGERMDILVDGAVRWLRGLGFETIVLFSMGSGARIVPELLERRGDDFSAWLDIDGHGIGDEADFSGTDGRTLPPVLFFSYDQSGASERTALLSKWADAGVQTRYRVIPVPFGPMDRDLETRIRRELVLWCAAAGR